MMGSVRYSALMGVFAVALASSADLPIGVEELLRGPVKAAEIRGAVKNCDRTAPRTIAPKVSASTKAKRQGTAVAKAEKGFKLFRWLL